VFARFPEHYDAMMAYHHTHVSMGRYGKFDQLLVRMARAGDAKLREEIAAEYSRFVTKEILTVQLVPGAIEFLKNVTPHLPVYLASATPEDELVQTLSNRSLSHWFKRVYGCPPWTKVKAINDVLVRENSSPIEALFVGDSAGDQRAAISTGVLFVARNSGLPFEDPVPQQFMNLHEIGAYLNDKLS
jgi:phosphoglycolate phosphatase-like HAD superfamily hydrolase